MKKKLILFALFFSAINAQTKDPNKLLQSAREKFEKVKDYEVDVSIKVDINFIKVPDTKAKIFFKQPDKVKLQSEGFAMLPKQGLNFSPAQLLKGDFSALFVRTETIDNRKLDVVKVIPNNDSADVVLSTLWIDAQQFVIRKIETTGKKSGTLQIELNYNDKNLALPSEVKFSFNPGTMPVDIPNNNQKPEEARSKKRGPMKGTVTLTYTNYKINKGIADSFFDDKGKKK